MNSARTNVLVCFLFALLLGAVYLAIHAGAAFSHSPGDYPWNPVQLLGDMLLRGTPLPKSAPMFMIVFLIVAVAAFTVLLSWQARRAANKRGNVALAHMATKAQTKVLRAKQRDRGDGPPAPERRHVVRAEHRTDDRAAALSGSIRGGVRRASTSSAPGGARRARSSSGTASKRPGRAS